MKIIKHQISIRNSFYYHIQRNIEYKYWQTEVSTDIPLISIKESIVQNDHSSKMLKMNSSQGSEKAFQELARYLNEDIKWQLPVTLNPKVFINLSCSESLIFQVYLLIGTRILGCPKKLNQPLLPKVRHKKNYERFPSKNSRFRMVSW